MKINRTISLTKITAFLVALTLILAISIPLAFGAQSSGETNVRSSYLIGFEETAPRGTVRGLIEAHGGEIYAEFNIVNALAAQLLPQQAAALARNPHIKYVEPDGIAHALGQEVPLGIDRVLGEPAAREASWGTSTGSGIGVAVLDTGIGPHEDLTVVGGVRFYLQGRLRQDNNYADGNGHGTHVAGTIAALDNSLGVVGVAPDADLYAVKVLGDTGSGSISAIVAGIEWAYNRFPAIQIINMSLGSNLPSTTLEAACNEAYAKGMLVVSSAGNTGNVAGTGDNVGYPAQYSSVIAVAASDEGNNRAYFSSTGPAVELIAPGVGVLSTVPSGYATYNGTSMASPHVAGVAALVWGHDNALTNIMLRSRLQSTAFSLGLQPEHQGYGLVRGDLALGVTADPQNPVAVTDVTIDQGDTASLEVGDTLTLTAIVSPSDATDTSVTWASDMEDIATVEVTTGLVTAVSEGTAIITVTANDVTNGIITDTITITVKKAPVEPPPAQGPFTVTINPTSSASYKWNSWVYITVVVLDEASRAPLSGADVTIIVQGEATYVTYVGVTDGTGSFTASHRVVNRSTPGDYTINAYATYANSDPVGAEEVTFKVSGR